MYFLFFFYPLLLLVEPSFSELQFPCKPPNTDFTFCNTSLPVAIRTSSLISLLTIQEKIQQLSDEAAGILRLGIPPYKWWSESLHGIATNGPGIDFNGAVKSATQFPQVILTAASFNRTLWAAVAEAIGVEARAMYNVGQAGLTFWAPNINIFRDPRWGRGQETPGEDPFVSSAYAIEYVRGFQGRNRKAIREVSEGKKRLLEEDDEMSGGLMLSACCKHYTAYDLEKWGGKTRYDFNAVVTRRDMVDTYEPPFKSCIEQGKATCLMCSYNALNGIPACANGDLLQKARNDWGFKGYITSDCDAVATIYENQNYTNTPEDAVAIALKAGTDINCGTYMKRHVESAIDQGKVSEKDVDQALSNLFSVLFHLGLFDGNPENSQFANFGIQDICSPGHQELALDAARQGMVLLKNYQRFLPWNKHKISSLALIGPMANISNIGGDYTGYSCIPGTILQGFQNHVRNTFYSPGSEDVACNSTAGIPEAVSTAKEVEYIILVVGLDLSEETEDHDRFSLLLPGNQTALVKSIASIARKPLVLVLTGGGPIDVSFAKDDPQIASIVWIGYPGETGGKALSEIIFGDYNPGGRLPMTWYPESFTNVPMTDMRMRADPSRGYPGRTHRFYTGDCAYKFGHGLSYSNITYRIIMAPRTLSLSRNIIVESERNAPYFRGNSPGFVNVKDLESCDSLKFSVEISVENNGGPDCSQAILVFSKVPKSYIGAPVKQVIGFSRIHVHASKSAQTSFLVDPCEHLSIADEHGTKILPLGSHVLLLENIEHILSIEV